MYNGPTNARYNDLVGVRVHKLNRRINTKRLYMFNRNSHVPFKRSQTSLPQRRANTVNAGRNVRSRFKANLGSLSCKGIFFRRTDHIHTRSRQHLLIKGPRALRAPRIVVIRTHQIRAGNKPR